VGNINAVMRVLSKDEIRIVEGEKKEGNCKPTNIEMIKRKEFEAMFLPHNQSGTQIWVMNKIRKLPIEIIQFALNLAALDFINYVRIDAESLAASSENHPKRPQVPFIQMNPPTATCMEVLYSYE
jgi:hypothetical protein